MKKTLSLTKQNIKKKDLQESFVDKLGVDEAVGLVSLEGKKAPSAPFSRSNQRYKKTYHDLKEVLESGEAKPRGYTEKEWDLEQIVAPLAERKIKEHFKGAVTISARRTKYGCDVPLPRFVAPTELKKEGDFLKTPNLPFGVLSKINNYHKEHKSMIELYYGLRDENEIEKSFEEMKVRVTGSGCVLKDKNTGETKSLKNRSRWNSDFRYDLSVKSRLENEVKGLKSTVLVTLTYDMNLVKQIIPVWWVLDQKAFVVHFNNMFVSNFLHTLKGYYQRQRRKWNYVGSAVEFHTGGGQNHGILHNHLIFYGQYVAPVKVLHRFWGLSQLNGVDVKKRKGVNVARYVSKYVAKNLGMFTEDPEVKRLSKWFWYFKRRLYNVRHKKSEWKRLGIPAQEYELNGFIMHGQVWALDPEKQEYKRKMRDLRKSLYQVDNLASVGPYDDA